jgi:hypothetical protein
MWTWTLKKSKCKEFNDDIENPPSKTFVHNSLHSKNIYDFENLMSIAPN